MRITSGAICAMLLLLFSIAPVGAQNISSTFLGEVTDQSGAAIPEAEIVLTNVDTGIATRGATNMAGAYSFPNLLAGRYTLRVSRQGFQSVVSEPLTLLSSTVMRQNFQLKVGQTTESTVVTAEAPLLQTASSTIGGSVTQRQLADLPMALQSVSALLNLGPGAQTSWGANAPATGGATHWGATNFSINGLTINDFGNGNGGSTLGLTLVNLPAISSLQEMNTNSVNNAAEFKAVGAVAMVTKQGTNAFHGSAFEYNQNTQLAANTFTLNRTGTPRAQLARNQFGANLGGPVIKNKAFFFFDYSGLRQRTATTVQLNVPTEAMRAGDFSGLATALYNPFTGEPFPGNRIPASMITSQTKTLLNYYPKPNYTPPVAGYIPGAPSNTGNFIQTFPVPKDFNTVTVRGDYQITSKDSIYGVVNRIVDDPWFQQNGSTPAHYGNYSSAGNKVTEGSLTHVHVFSGSLINDFRIGYSIQSARRTGQNDDFDPTTLFPQLQVGINRGLPSISMTGYAGISDYNKAAWAPQYIIQFTDNVNKVHGKHNFKFGFDEAGYKAYTRLGVGGLGSFGFTGSWTSGKNNPGVGVKSAGNAFADFLMGTANTASNSYIQPDQICYGRDFGFYAQDTWQVTTRMTLSYGLRYTYQTPWKVRDHMMTFYDPSTNQLVLPQDSTTATLPPLGNQTLFNAYKFTTTKALGLPLDYIQGDKNNFGPRIAIAYKIDNKMVLRGGYGIYYNFHPLFIGSRTDNNNPPWGGSSVSYTSKLPGVPTALFQPDITFANPFPSANQGNVASANPTIYSMQRDFQMADAQQWNLTLERQIGANWVTRASYVGSKTSHLPFYLSDLNVNPAQTPNVATQAARPRQPWGTINSTRSGGDQKLNQLQLEAMHKMSSGMSLQLEYSWTRSLDNVELTGQTNWNFPHMDYGNSSYIRRHQLVANYVYELPFGRGKRYLSHAPALVNGVLGNWQVSGITTYTTGTPFSVAFQIPSSYIGWVGSRADVVAGADPYSKGSGHDITTGVQWLNTAAFTPPKPWTYGNVQRNAYWGPGMWNWDISLMKGFKVPLREGMMVQLRADFLNSFNHFNLGNPSATAPDTRDGGAAIPTFGKITGGSGNRIVQVGARLQF